jgi:hypothetical protein
MSEKNISAVSRLLFLGAFILLALSMAEVVARLCGYTILRTFSPGRLLEYAALLLIFVLALLLRQIRDRVARA